MIDPNLILQADRPEKVFSGLLTIDEIFKFRKELMKKYHPDVWKDTRANNVVTKINEFVLLAHTKIKAGTWTGDSKKHVVLGKTKISFMSTKPGEYGADYVTTSTVVRTFDSANKTFAENEVSSLNKVLKYVNGVTSVHFKKEILKYIPTSVEMKDNFIVIGRDPHSFALDDYLKKHEFIDQRHVAWILGNLYSFACFMSEWKAAHQGLTPHSIFINAEKHEVKILTGWGFMGSNATKPKLLPNFVARNVKTTGKYDGMRTDLECIKSIGRVCLGDEYGPFFKTDVKKELKTWLMSPAGSDPLKEYSDWEKVRDKCFKKEFVKWGIGPADIYEKE